MKMTKVLRLSLIVSGLSLPLVADTASDTQLMVDAYCEIAKDSAEQGNGPDAVKQFEMAASLGNPEAMAVIATLCENGMGRPKSIRAATLWYKKLVDMGYPEFTEKLASLYVIGTEDGERQIEKGLDLYKRVSVGNPHAQFVIGLIYDVEIKTAGHEEEALKWYRMAAEAKDSQALYVLGTKYILGEMVAQDGNKAFKLFKESSDLGYDQGKYNLAICYAKGIGTEADIEYSALLLSDLAKKGHAESLYVLALMKFSGEIKIATDDPKKMMEKAAKLGNNDAKQYLEEIKKQENK